jgi:hypothetical protein
MGYQRNMSLSGACCSGCASGASKCGGQSLGALTDAQKASAGLVGTGLTAAVGYGVGRMVGGPKGGLVGVGLSLVWSLYMRSKS